MPRFPDRTGAIKRRVLIIPFNNDFSLGRNNRDEFINDKLEKEENQEALIQLALIGLRRIIANKRLTIPKCVQDELKIFDQENNPILTFLEEKDTEYPNGEWYIRKPTSEVYWDYERWCDDNGYKAFGKKKFSTEMKKFKDLEIKNIRENGKVSKYFIQEQLVN